MNDKEDAIGRGKHPCNFAVIIESSDSDLRESMWADLSSMHLLPVWFRLALNSEAAYACVWWKICETRAVLNSIRVFKTNYVEKVFLSALFMHLPRSFSLTARRTCHACHTFLRIHLIRVVCVRCKPTKHTAKYGTNTKWNSKCQ